MKNSTFALGWGGRRARWCVGCAVFAPAALAGGGDATDG
jgi:hypothetical protein